MARPLDLAHLLAVVRLTRGGAPPIPPATLDTDAIDANATESAVAAELSAGPGSGGEGVSEERLRGGTRGLRWGWPARTLFRRRGAAARSPVQPSESGPVAAEWGSEAEGDGEVH